MQEDVNKKEKWMLWLSLILMAGAFCLQYYGDFGNLLKRWDNEDFSYCYLVPFLFVYLVYTNRKALRDHEQSPSISGFVVLLISGVWYLGGRLGSIETLIYMGMWAAVVGSAMLVLGVRLVKALAFPFLILAFSVPLPPFLNNLFTFKLKLISSSLSVKMMQAAGISVFGEGNIIDLGITQLQVVDACSGLRYVYPLLLMGFVFAYLFHKKWWERVIVIGATVPISVLSNALRIAITGFLTIRVSPEVAEGFFHGFSGWLIFMVSFVFLALLSWLLKMVKRRAPKRDGDLVKSRKPETASDSFDLGRTKLSYIWAGSAVFLLFWGLNIALASTQIIPMREKFETFPTEIGNWKGEKTFLREEILKSLWADDYVQIEFRNHETGDMLLLFVPYYEYQGTMHTAHAPVSCLVGGGFAPISREIIEREFPPSFGRVKIRQMVLEKNKQRLLSNYWFHQRGRFIVNEYANKWFLFWDSLTKRRTDGALVRIEMPMRRGQDLQTAQATVDSFTRELMKILPEYIPD